MSVQNFAVSLYSKKLMTMLVKKMISNVENVKDNKKTSAKKADTLINTDSTEIAIKKKKDIIPFIGVDNTFADRDNIDKKLLSFEYAGEIIECISYYIDVNNDLVKVGIYENKRVTDTEICAENEALLNSSFDEKCYSDNDDNVTVSKRQSPSKITDNMIEIAESTLGTYRNYIQHNEAAKEIILSKRIYYVQGTYIRKPSDGPNTSHARLYYCVEANKDRAVALIKKICKDNELKVTIY